MSRPVGGFGRRHADHVRRRRARPGRPARRSLLQPAVARRADDQHVGGRRGLDRVDQARAGRGRAAEAEVDDPRAVGGGIADALGDRARRARAAGVEHLDGHDPRPERDADDAACRSPRPRSCPARACRGRCRREVLGRAARRQVDAVDVVDVAVAVVVDAVAGDLAEVRPDVAARGRGGPGACPSRSPRRRRRRRCASSHAPGRSNTVPGATAHCSSWSGSACPRNGRRGQGERRQADQDGDHAGPSAMREPGHREPSRVLTVSTRGICV